MRVFWIVTTLVIVLIGGGSVWFYLQLDAIQKRYEREFAEEETRFRGLDTRFPFHPPPALPADRLDAYLRVRAVAAEVFDGRSRESSTDMYHAHATQILMLRAMAAQMDKESMSLREYASLSRRVHGILARGVAETAPAPLQELHRDWKRTLTTTKYPQGLPLPEPDASTPQSDVDLVVARAEALRESMTGDMLVAIVQQMDEKR